jgi:hypothetical protein
MRNIVFLFGAGASFGAGSILPETPPLGNQLFKELQKICLGTWGQLPSEVTNIFQKKGFEEGMDILYKKSSPMLQSLLRDMALYFIQFRPINNQSLYCKLTSFFKQINLLDKILLSTLNYECLLEQSLLSHSIRFNYFPTSLDQNNVVPLLKLHGSCNMFAKNIQAKGNVIYSSGVLFEADLQSLDIDASIKYILENSLPPAMCLYMPGKPISISPSTIKNIQNMWAKYVLNSSAIFTIGVKPIEEDSHIWKPIASSKAKIYHIGDQKEWEAWAKKNNVTNSMFLGSKFNISFNLLKSEIQIYAN